MTSIATWYDVLGVLPDANRDDICEAWQARRQALQPGPLAGAPPQVLSAADRARQEVEEAWRVLADPTARESYDEEIGFVRPGEGLAPSRRGPDRSSRVQVPDVTGLFFGACLEVAGRVGLHVAPVQLTSHPMPVEGLAVGQTPGPGELVHRDSTLTVQVWHPSEPGPAAYSA
jgi:curved DNA-binding protein CbpA